MKNIWKNFIDWLIPKTRNEENSPTVEYSPKPENPKEPPGLTDNNRLEQHMNLDLSHSVEGGKATPIELTTSKNANKYSEAKKIQQFIARKKNRKPFYKDENKKDWE